MLVGHYAVALAAKRKAPKAPLWTLFLAVEWADLLWPILLLNGVETVRIDASTGLVTPLVFLSYPITHSLLMDVVWGLLIGGLVGVVVRDRTAGVWVGLAVVSHWVLDFITHVPDLPLWPGGPKYGLGLWHSLPATAALELTIFAAGIWVYVRAFPARDATGRWAFWSLIVFLLASYAANLFGPLPPSVTAVAWVTMALWLLLPWAAWVERHRAPVKALPG